LGRYGVGFNAQWMHDQPYTIIVNSTGIMERKIGTCGEEGLQCSRRTHATANLSRLSSPIFFPCRGFKPSTGNERSLLFCLQM
jgi:hypothetical protein